MTCVHTIHGMSPSGPMFICMPPPAQKLRCSDGRHVWVEWHDYMGPTVWHDRHCERPHHDWPDDRPVAEAMDWFIGRGRIA